MLGLTVRFSNERNFVRSVERVAGEVCDGTMIPHGEKLRNFDLDGILFECEVIDVRVSAREEIALVLIESQPGSGYLLGLLGCTRAEWRTAHRENIGPFMRIEAGDAIFSLDPSDPRQMVMNLPCGFDQTIEAEFSTLVVCELEGFRDDAPPDYASEAGAVIRAQSLSWGSEVEVAQTWSMSRSAKGASGGAGRSDVVEVMMRRKGPPWPRRYALRLSESDGTTGISRTSSEPIKAVSAHLGPAEVQLLRHQADLLSSRGSSDEARLFFAGTQSSIGGPS